MPDAMQNYLTKMLEHCSLSFLKASPWQAKNWEINSFSKFCLRNFKFTPISQYIDRCQTCQGLYRTYLVIRFLSYLIKNAVGGRRKAEKSWKKSTKLLFQIFFIRSTCTAAAADIRTEDTLCSLSAAVAVGVALGRRSDSCHSGPRTKKHTGSALSLWRHCR